jgi:hypothetical protein
MEDKVYDSESERYKKGWSLGKRFSKPRVVGYIPNNGTLNFQAWIDKYRQEGRTVCFRGVGEYAEIVR